MRIAVAIATAGRRDILADTAAFIAGQSRSPDEFLVCPARPEDVDIAVLEKCFPQLRIITGNVGSSAQRNAIMDATDADIVVFFDDDFLPAPDYLAEIERLFETFPDIALATGLVVADGILGPGIEIEEGRRIVAMIGANNGSALEPTYNGYGCNMAVRMEPIRRNNLRFDENLPLYSWLEDVDFSKQLAPFGRIVKAERLRGVHLGTKKSGRSPGKRLGYSQIANRVYIMRKGNMSLYQACDGSLRNFAINLARSFRPEPWVDRRGRLVGNLIALGDLLRGRIDPRKIVNM